MSTSITLDSSGASLKEESPRNRSSSFSISAILSDDIGGPRRSTSFNQTTPNSSLNYETHTPKRPREADNRTSLSFSQHHPQITLTEAANIVSPKSSTAQGPHYHPVAVASPPMHSPRQNMSISSSPLNPSLLQQSSDKEDLLSDSLGVLSTVAMFHNELGSSLGTPVRDRLADIQIASACEGSDRSSDWNGADPVINLSQRAPTKHRTPSILKRRNRTASLRSDSSGDESVSKEKPNFNAGFLSPLADEKSALINQKSGFSPSIFLSRPEESHQSTKHSFFDNDSNPEDDFTTSTPIKQDKENMRDRQPTRWSPNILRRGRKQLLKDSNESGSDSENPVKRPRPALSPPHKKKSKARTKLSPLLENACSPIPKTEHAPSPLTQTPTRPVNLNLEQTRATQSVAHHIIERPGFLNPASLSLLSQAQPTCVIPQVYPTPSPYSIQPSTMVAPMQQYPPTIISPTHQYPRPILSPTLIHQHTPFVRVPFYLSRNATGFVPIQVMSPSVPCAQPIASQSFNIPRATQIVGSLPVNTSQNIPSGPFHGSMAAPFINPRQDEGLKSVPPRFIFSNMRPEGKRSRLTDAINKSLSETPMETTKLPSEWTKYACGQTIDQRDLTNRAKSFIRHCKPRALNFEGDSD